MRNEEFEVFSCTCIIGSYLCGSVGNSSSLDNNKKSSDSGSDSGSIREIINLKKLTVQFVPSQNADKLEGKQSL